MMNNVHRHTLKELFLSEATEGVENISVDEVYRLVDKLFKMCRLYSKLEKLARKDPYVSNIYEATWHGTNEQRFRDVITHEVNSHSLNRDVLKHIKKLVKIGKNIDAEVERMFNSDIIDELIVKLRGLSEYDSDAAYTEFDKILSSQWKFVINYILSTPDDIRSDPVFIRNMKQVLAIDGAKSKDVLKKISDKVDDLHKNTRNVRNGCIRTSNPRLLKTLS